MNFRRTWKCLLLLSFFSASFLFAGDTIPKAAWKRPIGLPLENAGGRKPALAATGMIDDGYWQGAPVGGFGAGTFSRTYRGDFARWHMKGGVHKYQTVWTNQFAMYQKSEGASEGVAQVLMSSHPENGQLRSWKWDYPVGAGDYYSLYPKSWYDYRWDKFPAHVILEQFSPVLPNNYRESSYPVAVYRWHAENPTDKPVTVSVLLSWTNMLGWFRDFSPNMNGALDLGNHNRFVQKNEGGSGQMKGIVFDRIHPNGVKDDWDGQMTIATLESPGVEVTYQTTFLPETSDEVWKPFAADGRLSNSSQSWVSSGEHLSGAIAVRFTLKPGEKRVIPMVIAWDLPIVTFGSGRKWYRHYTNFYGTSGTNSWEIARDGLLNASQWSDQIDAWQAPYINDESKPLWYRGMLFNEMYILADGGSFWGHQVGSDTKTPDTFGFLECFDYAFYATLDVRFYGSMPLVKFWPDIDKQVLRQFADTVSQDLTDKYLWQWKSQQTGSLNFRIRKAKGAVPHDLGVPQEDPFAQVNSFSWQNTNDWKDLNSKFVLMIYRDYIFTGKKDTEFLRYTWPSVQEALQHLQQYDRTGDGIPQNDDYPDQTYDVWIVHGESAYCGGLWLAALRAAEEIAKVLGDPTSATKYHAMFLKGQDTYVKKLWNGEYFRYDTMSEYRDNVQADQLAGQWYANMTGLGDLVPREMQLKSLKKIYDFNVMKFAKGEMGAVNGMGADGSIITSNEQVQEVWTGTTFGVAALMLSDGMKDEGYRTAWGVFHTTYETKGYWFRTPEAWENTGYYRASMYMRPAAIWAMEMTSPPK
jgi:non-lysosomal glucosylceramidase